MAVTMYTTSWCGECFRAKRFLKAKQVTFEEINIEEDDQAAQLVMQSNGGKRRVPTFQIDGAFHGNPSLDELAVLVGVS